jgi:hypothetical protein
VKAVKTDTENRNAMHHSMFKFMAPRAAVVAAQFVDAQPAHQQHPAIPEVVEVLETQVVKTCDGLTVITYPPGMPISS